MSVFRLLKSSVHNVIRPRILNACVVRFLSYTPKEYGYEEGDPAPLFIAPEVQTLLRKLTRVDLQKVYRMKKLGNKELEQPVYKFMTTEELEAVVKDAHERVKDLLQIPPVVKVCNIPNNVISKDPELQGLNTCRYVFTDITYGVKDSDRLIVVREPDGTLQHAEGQLRHRMNQLYFPKPSRNIKTPKMFQDEYLESLLNREEYEFILDRACAQFEPYDSMYQRVTSLTYEHVNSKCAFEKLRSTRHFGSLTFYLAWFKNIDNLLLELIETTHIEEVNCLLELFSKLHDTQLRIGGYTSTDAIKEYITKHGQKKALLELALQAYHDFEKQKSEYGKGLQIAHGLM